MCPAQKLTYSDLPQRGALVVTQRQNELSHVTVEQIVSGNDDHAENGAHRERQLRQERQHDHAPADHPDDAGHLEVLKVEVKGPREAKKRELEQDEPETAQEEEPREVRCAVLAPVEEALVPAKNTNAGAQKCVTQRVKKTPASDRRRERPRRRARGRWPSGP